jgi:hypothetical protein
MSLVLHSTTSVESDVMIVSLKFLNAATSGQVTAQGGQGLNSPVARKSGMVSLARLLAAGQEAFDDVAGRTRVD